MPIKARSGEVNHPLREREPAEPGQAGLNHLRFGSHLVSNSTVHALHEFLTKQIALRLGLRSELVVETSYDSCIGVLNDVCFGCSLPYVMFERQGMDLAIPVAAPVLKGER